MKRALLILLFSIPALAQDPAIFPGKVSQVYRIRVDKGAMLLESIMTAIQKSSVRDGVILTAAGALSECTFHGVGGSKQTVTEEMEINHLGGIIAAGEPHLHVTLTTAKRGAFGGHLEKGCKVSNHVELTLMQLSGDALERQKGSLEKKK